jgi:hypothetical protein
MARPSTVPTWATAGGSQVEPPSGTKASGFVSGERGVAQFFNWLHGKAGEWLQWVSDHVPAKNESNIWTPPMAGTVWSYGLVSEFDGGDGRKARVYVNSSGEYLLVYGCKWNGTTNLWDLDTGISGLLYRQFLGDGVCRFDSAGPGIATSFADTVWTAALTAYPGLDADIAKGVTAYGWGNGVAKASRVHGMIQISGGVISFNNVWGIGPYISAWAGNTAYALGDRRTHDSGKAYEVITAGTSAASGGPTGTGSNITDGSVHWKYLGTGSFGVIWGGSDTLIVFFATPFSDTNYTVHVSASDVGSPTKTYVMSAPKADRGTDRLTLSLVVPWVNPDALVDLSIASLNIDLDVFGNQ